MFVFSGLKSSYFTPAILLLSDAEKSLLSSCHSLLKFFFLLRLICLGFFYNFTSPGLCKYFFLSLLIVLHTTSKPSCFRITLNSSGFIRICFVTFIPLLSFPKLIFCGNNPCSLLLNNLHFLIYFVVVVDKGNVYLWLAIIYMNSLHDRANFLTYFIPISHCLKQNTLSFKGGTGDVFVCLVFSFCFFLILSFGSRL